MSVQCLTDRPSHRLSPAPRRTDIDGLVPAARAPLVPAAADAARPGPPGPVAEVLLPVARVCVDVALAHLDRLFDYAVPAGLDAAARPGCRVRVRFAGRLVAGYLLERVAGSEHVGSLLPLSKVTSSEPVLTPEVARLARLVADRWAGTLSDVLRLAVPPRHARVEAEPHGRVAGAQEPVPPPDPGSWARYDGGPGFLAALAGGGPGRSGPRAVWEALPGPRWPAELALSVQAAASAGRGVVVVVPDARDLERVAAAARAAVGAEAVVALSADLGPAERYRRFLRLARGEARVVVGTRAAAFAPVPDLGLVVVWDDGDDLHSEPRAPYPHARDVLALRAHLTGAAALVGGFSPSVEAETLLRTGWARPLRAPRSQVRRAAPRVEAAGSDLQLARDPAARAARLPSLAWQAARDALATGASVLVQVPRRGYQTSLACAPCRTPARCAHCHGPLSRHGPEQPPSCGWCGRPAADWSCPVCRATALRAGVVGERRTAEELARAFPGVPVRTSGGGHVLAEVTDEAALVVATPGAEPVVAGGYGAVLLLDAWAVLARPDLRAAEEALRRWCAAAALARPAEDGGRVVVTADAAVPAVAALVRWDPLSLSSREADERAELGFPPATRVAALDGEPVAVADLLADLDLPASAAVLGPVPLPSPRGPRTAAPAAVGASAAAGSPRSGPVEPQHAERVLVRVPRRDGPALAAALKAAQGARSARKGAGLVRVRLDPLDLG